MAHNDASQAVLVFRPPRDGLPGQPKCLSGWRHVGQHVTTPPGIRQRGQVAACHQGRSDHGGQETREREDPGVISWKVCSRPLRGMCRPRSAMRRRPTGRVRYRARGGMSRSTAQGGGTAGCQVWRPVPRGAGMWRRQGTVRGTVDGPSALASWLGAVLKTLPRPPSMSKTAPWTNAASSLAR